MGKEGETLPKAEMLKVKQVKLGKPFTLTHVNKDRRGRLSSDFELNYNDDKLKGRVLLSSSYIYSYEDIVKEGICMPLHSAQNLEMQLDIPEFTRNLCFEVRFEGDDPLFGLKVEGEGNLFIRKWVYDSQVARHKFNFEGVSLKAIMLSSFQDIKRATFLIHSYH
ncbi:MAG TPA: hypothetical protein VKC89_03535 [Patescibacteria group bacterium]|nr:hypothetical protein [Patescibacteria group bacterium]